MSNGFSSPTARNLVNRSKSCKSVLPRKGRKRCWLISNPKKRIENAYTQCGRIANSPELPVAGCFLIRISALEMLILSAGELQIRPNGEKGVPLRGRNLVNRSKSCKSVLPRKGRKRCWLIFNSKLRIGNAYTQDGRIANSPERLVVG